MKKEYNLKVNPFRSTPAIDENEILWVAFNDLKEKIEGRLKRSMKIPNSSLVLNWGEYGSGKTHAARYFSKERVLFDLSQEVESSIPYSLVFSLPKGKEPVKDIFISVIDNLDLDDLRKKFDEAGFKIEQIIESSTRNILYKSVLYAIFNSETDKHLLKKYLYGQSTKAEISALNENLSDKILRPLNKDNDYILLLASLFTCMTTQKKVYSSIVIWLDEFEDIQVLNSTNIDKTNNFLRELLDYTPNNLLIFINLTQTSLFGVSDLSEYIYDSVKSRIRERINFEIPNEAELKKYLSEILTLFRVGKPNENPYHPFEEGLINTLFKDMSNSSLRAVNEALSLLIELADMDNIIPTISEKYYGKVKSEIIGWKDE